MSVFRTKDAWREDILTLQESALFELLRNVFGSLKTPFNKHKLIEDLAAFLSRPEIQETTARFIDEKDRKIIAAVALLENPLPGDLETFFAGDFSWMEVQALILNLEERMILYRYQEEGTWRLAFCPLFEPVLKPLCESPEILFPSVPAPPPEAASGETPAPLLRDDRLAAALLAFAAGQDGFPPGEGNSRKKSPDPSRKIFPGIDTEKLFHAFAGAGLIGTGSSRSAPDLNRIRRFGNLDPVERLIWLSAGLLAWGSRTEEAVAWSHRTRLHRLAQLIGRTWRCLEGGRRYSRKTLKQIVWFCARKMKQEPEPFPPDMSPASALPESGACIDAMAATGLLLPSPDGDYTVPLDENSVPGDTGGLVPGLSRNGLRRGGLGGSAETKPEKKPVISLDTPFSCILYPGILWNDAADLALLCEPREYGAVVRFEITRESAVRGFDAGLSAADIIARLENLSGFPVAQGFTFTLKDWEERYRAVTLYEGTVLCLSEERRYLAETGPLASLVRRRLAPGVFLLDPGVADEALESLERSGVDIVARPGISPEIQSWRNPWPSLGAGKAPFSRGTAPDMGENQEERAEEVKARFRKALEAAKLSSPAKEELASRIERRLILSESQIQDTGVRAEKMEARNLDYPGKAVIARMALQKKSLVEVVWPAPGGAERRVYGIPQALEKKSGESVLVLRPIPAPDDPSRAPGSPTPGSRAAGPKTLASKTQGGGAQEEGDLRVSLGKISLIRRIKQSLYE